VASIYLSGELPVYSPAVIGTPALSRVLTAAALSGERRGGDIKLAAPLGTDAPRIPPTTRAGVSYGVPLKTFPARISPVAPATDLTGPIPPTTPPPR
jgi:hypothetical protein